MIEINLFRFSINVFVKLQDSNLERPNQGFHFPWLKLFKSRSNSSKKKKSWNQDFKCSSLQILNQCFIKTSRLKSPKVASIQARVFTFLGYSCSNQNPNQVIEKKEARIKSWNLQHSSQVRLEALVCKYKYSKASQFGISFLQFLNWQLLWRKTQEIHFFFSPKR